MEKLPESNQSSEYWRMVWRLAWQSAWKRSAMKPLIAALLLFVVTLFITGLLLTSGIVEYSFFKDLTLANVLVGFAQIVIALVSLLVAFAVLLYSTPAKLHEEQQAQQKQLKREIDQQKLEIAGLKEVDQPVLDLYFDPDDSSSIKRGQSEHGNTAELYRLKLRNRSDTQPVSDIHVIITQVEMREPLDSLPAELGFMHDHSKRLEPTGILLVDVMQIITRTNVIDTVERYSFFAFENQDAHNQSGRILQSCEFVIEAWGENTPKIHKTFELVVNESDTSNPYRFGEKLHEQEEIR